MRLDQVGDSDDYVHVCIKIGFQTEASIFVIYKSEISFSTIDCDGSCRHKQFALKQMNCQQNGAAILRL